MSSFPMSAVLDHQTVLHIGSAFADGESGWCQVSRQRHALPTKQVPHRLRGGGQLVLPVTSIWPTSKPHRKIAKR